MAMLQATSDGVIVVELKLESDDYSKGLTSAVKQTESFTDKVKSTFIGATVFKVAEKGWELISGSIEKATNRLDSLSKAQNVMSILSGSTEKATEIVNELTDAVSDTAYGLDSAATSTQKLATSGLELDDSAKMVEDLMDAISFYGDGTNETLENVVDAMAKMNSSGKISADQWQRLTDAGIPVLKIFAEKTGMSMAEVSDAFSNSKISAQEFNEILTDALENGTESFPSVAGKAKEMAGSFATSFSNMSARIAIGVANVITAFNNFLSDSGLPSLQENIANFGSVIKNGLNWVASNLPTILNGALDLLQQCADAMPSLTSAVQGVIDFITQNAGGVWETVKEAGQWVLDKIPAICSILDTLAPAIAGVFAALAVIKTYTTIMATLPKIMAAISTAQAAINAVMALNPFVLVAAAIAALVVAFVYLWNTSEDFRNFWINLWDAIQEAVGNAVTWIQNAWDGVVEFFTVTAPAAFQSFLDWCQQLADTVAEFFTVTIPAAFQSFVDTIVNFFTVTIPEAFNSFIAALGEFFGVTIPYWVGYAVGYVVAKLADWAAHLLEFYTVTIPNFINGIVEWICQLPGKFAEWLTQTMDNIKQWGQETIDAGIQTATDFINGIIDWVKQLPGKFTSWLTNTLNNINTWCGNVKDAAIDAGSKFINGIINWICQLPGKFTSWLSNTLNNIKNWAVNMKNQAVQAGTDFFNGVVDEVSKIPAKMLNLGKNIVDGIKNGIKNAWESFQSWFSNLASGLVDGFKDALGIASPSKVFKKEAKWIPEGIIEGIESTMPKAVKLMSNAGDELAGAFNADGLSSRVNLETRVGEARAFTGAGNAYTVNQTINSHDALTPSEMAQEAKNAMRRLAWQ